VTRGALAKEEEKKNDNPGTEIDGTMRTKNREQEKAVCTRESTLRRVKGKKG